MSVNKRRKYPGLIGSGKEGIDRMVVPGKEVWCGVRCEGVL